MTIVKVSQKIIEHSLQIKVKGINSFDCYINFQEQAPTSTTTPTVPDDGNRQPAQSRLGPLPPASKMSLNNMVKKTPPQTPVPSSAATAATTAEKVGLIKQSCFHCAPEKRG